MNTTGTLSAARRPWEETAMSNQVNPATNGDKSTPPAVRGWRQKYGATLMLVVFGLLAIVMVVMQKKAEH